MTEEEKIVDFATVRDLLKGAQERRRDLTYEQRAALFHAEWAASENRNGYPTISAVFEELKAAIVLRYELLAKVQCRLLIPHRPCS